MQSRQRKTFISKVAAAALAFGLSGSGIALAQKPEPDVRSASDTVSILAPPELQTSWNIATDPLVPVMMIAGLGSIYGAFCLYSASRKVRGSFLRAAAGGTLALTLLNPEILQQQFESQPTDIVIAIDKSPSQMLGDRMANTDIAYRDIVASLSQIAGVNVHTIDFGGPDVDRTNLLTALQSDLPDLSKDHLGGVIVLTDGQVHDMDLQKDLNLKQPVHHLVTGHDQEFDRHIILEDVPPFGLLGEEQTIRFSVVDDGVRSDAQEMVDITVAQDDGTIISEKTIMAGTISEVKVPVSRIGANNIIISVSPLDGEITQDNNQIITGIEGVRDSINVLMLSGHPHAGSKPLRRVFKSDADVNLVHFTIMRPPEKQDITPLDELALTPIPIYEMLGEQLEDFDLIVFDQYQYRAILAPYYLNLIANYVENGGSVMVTSGAEYASKFASLDGTILSKVLPAKPTGQITKTPYKPQITKTGGRHPVTRDLNAGQNSAAPDWGRWLTTVHSVVPENTALLNGANNNPLLVLNRQEAGRAAMILSGDAWMWARNVDGGGPHDALIKNTVQWLLKNPAFEDDVLKLYQDKNEVIIQQQSLEDDVPPVNMISPSGKEISVSLSPVSPGLWQARVPANEIGIYKVEQQFSNDKNAPKQAIGLVGSATPKELMQTRAITKLLEPLLEKTNGSARYIFNEDGSMTVPQIKPLDKVDETTVMSGNDWIGLSINAEKIIKDQIRLPLIPPWLGAILCIGLIGAAYMREGERTFFAAKQQTDRKGPDAPSL